MLQQAYKLGLNMLQASQFRRDKKAKRAKRTADIHTWCVGVAEVEKRRQQDEWHRRLTKVLRRVSMLTIQGIHVYIYIYIHIDIRKLTSDTTKQNGVGLRVGIKNDILSFTVTSKSSVFRSYDRFLGVCAASLKLLCEPPYAKGPCTEIVYTLALK